MDPAKSHNKTGLRFLWKRDPGPLLDVEEHYIYASKPSLKLTAISLVNILVRLSPDCGRKALKAYSEACELMDLVEESDPATDILQSKAADSVFKALLEETAENAVDTTTVVYMEEVAATIEKLAEESKRKVEVIEDGGDTLDWKKAGAANALYKLCKSIDCSSTGNFMEVVNELQSALADIMGDCVESVGGVLVDKCTKWAQDFQEGKLLKAVYIAGKNTALLERLGLCPTMHICTTTTESSMVTTSAELVASEEQVKPLEQAVKVTQIEPVIEEATEEEAPACSPTQEVPGAEKKVDESPPIVEKSTEVITVMPHTSEPEAESAPVESHEVSKLNDSTKMPGQAEPGRQETVGQPSAEGVGVEEKAEGAPTEEKAPEVEGKSEE